MIAEADAEKKTTYIAFLDTKKAFDVVWHKSLLRKLYLLGIQGNLWMLAHDMYKDLKAQVKWDGMISEKFPIKQGLQQGGVCSPNLFKPHENPLFILLETLGLGLKSGSIYLGQIIVADDKTFISDNPFTLQTILDVATHNANTDRYVNGINKSQVVIRNKKPGDERHQWKMNGEQLETVSEYTHVGITRHEKNTPIGDKIVQSGRRATYSLMGSGLHGMTGVNPIMCLKLWNSYVIPSCTYGLESIIIPDKEIQKLQDFEKKTLKHLQSLPINTANPVPYILLGALPVREQLHKRKLGLLGTITRKENTKEYELAMKQLSTKALHSGSWFQGGERLLLHYGLPSAHDLLKHTPPKEKWKAMVERAIHKLTTEEMIKTASTKTSLKYLNYNWYEVGKPHPIWATVENDTKDVERAGVKVRLVAGTYKLQADRARINRADISTCPLCKLEAEDRIHFIARCPQLSDIREVYIRKYTDLFQHIGQPQTLTYTHVY
jgi:hypothetical protein